VIEQLLGAAGKHVAVAVVGERAVEGAGAEEHLAVQRALAVRIDRRDTREQREEVAVATELQQLDDPL